MIYHETSVQKKVFQFQKYFNYLKGNGHQIYVLQAASVHSTMYAGSYHVILTNWRELKLVRYTLRVVFRRCKVPR